jgi:N-acetylglucosamine kinase-like BadF-type ATPase
MIDALGISCIDALYGSAAGTEYFGDGLPREIARRVPCAQKVRIEGDGCALISGMLGHRDGACMISGTGSSVYVRQGEEYYHLGGWGHLIDNCGSGFMLGRLAIQAACRFHDGIGEPTLLCELLEKQCGEPIWDHFLTLYKGDRPYIATFAGTVFEARRRGDRVAARIFSECVNDLVNIVFAAKRRMNKPFELVLNGGIFASFPEYGEAVKGLCPPGVSVLFSDVPPIYGAAVEAMYDAGLTCDDAFKRNFLAGL